MRSLALAVLLVPASAAAHIHLMAPLARTDSVTGDQKDQHCGVLNQTRTTRVTTFMRGETITVTWMEPIDHPGWFRIAFQPNGDTFPIPKMSNGNAVVAGTPQASNMPTEDLTGMTDAATGAIILKDRIADGTLSTTVTLPDMECSTCTLQFIQVMIDKPPYTEDAASDDIYFNCADIVLSGAPAMPDAGGGGGEDASVTGNPATTGGCSTTGSGAGLAIGLALLTARRRRDRAPA